nr:alpha/beta hydrolase domain-containing protein 17B-like [Dermatophagoides farinae]
MNLTRQQIDMYMSIFMKTMPEQSYTMEYDPKSNRYEIHLKDGDDYSNCHRYRQHCDAFIEKSNSGNNIACLMLRPMQQPKYTILFNHGSTVDLGKICNFLYTLAKRLDCNIFTYDYSGYGQSTGQPSEKMAYADSETVWSLLLNKYRLQPQQILIYGQSIGTGPTLYLASIHRHVKGVILHSSFQSIAKLYIPWLKKCPDYDVFRNIEMIEKVESPVLFLHGSDDRNVPLSHVKILFEKCPNPVIPLWIEGGHHDDLYTFESYVTRLKRFIDQDLEYETSGFIFW